MMTETGFRRFSALIMLHTLMQGVNGIILKIVHVDIGSDVTLNCSGEGKEAFDWFRTKAGTRSCSNLSTIKTDGNLYLMCERLTVNGFIQSVYKKRFSIIPGGYHSSSLTSLKISNITTDDSGTYFCVQLNKPKVLSTVYLRVSGASITTIAPETTSSMEKQMTEFLDFIQNRKPWTLIAITTGSPLLLVSIFLFAICLICRKRNPKLRSTFRRDDHDIERQTSLESSMTVNAQLTTLRQNAIRLPDIVSSFSSSSSFSHSFISSTAYSYDYPNAEEVVSLVRNIPHTSSDTDNSTNINGGYTNAPRMQPAISAQVHSSRSSSRRSNSDLVSRFSHGVARIFSSRRNRGNGDCHGNIQTERSGYVNVDDSTGYRNANELNQGPKPSSTSQSSEFPTESESTPYSNCSEIQSPKNDGRKSYRRSVRRLKSCPTFGRTENGRQVDDQRMALLENLLENLKQKLS